VLDPRVVADPVEEHRSWPEAESSREDLAVIGEDLIGCTVLAEGEVRASQTGLAVARATMRAQTQ